MEEDSQRRSPPPGNKSYECIFCLREFCHYRYLETHMNQHTGEKPHSCTKCDLHFNSFSQLWDHRQVTHLEVTQTCEFCGKVFSNVSTLYSHRRDVHRLEWEATRDDRNLMPEIVKSIVVNRKLLPETTTPTAIRDHTASKNDDDMCGQQKTTPTPVYNKTSKSKKRAANNAKKQWTCDICGKMFFRCNSYSLDRHKKTVHRKSRKYESQRPLHVTEQSPIYSEKDIILPSRPTTKAGKRFWQCDICGRSFYRRDSYSLTRHKKTVHRDVFGHQQKNVMPSNTRKPQDSLFEGTKRFWQCEICDRVIDCTNGASLKRRHLRDVHGLLKVESDSFFPELLQEASLLDEKKEIFNEIKPKRNGRRFWKCEICGKVFHCKDRHSLNRHLRNVHKRGPLPFKEYKTQPPAAAKSNVGATPVTKSINSTETPKVSLGTTAPKREDGWKCDVCGKVFYSSLFNLNRHKRSMHPPEPVFLDEKHMSEVEDDDSSCGELLFPTSDKTDCNDPSSPPPTPPPDFQFYPPFKLFCVPVGIRHPERDQDPSFFLHLNRYSPENSCLTLTSSGLPIRHEKTLMSESEKQKFATLKNTPDNGNSGAETDLRGKRKANQESLECKKCGRVLAHKWSLRRHLKIPDCISVKKLLENPVKSFRYWCYFCKKEFGDDRYKLLRHIATHHRFQGSSAEPQNQLESKDARQGHHSDYSCAFCKFKSKIKRKMQQHILANHKEMLGTPRKKNDSMTKGERNIVSNNRDPENLQRPSNPTCSIVPENEESQPDEIFTNPVLPNDVTNISSKNEYTVISANNEAEYIAGKCLSPVVLPVWCSKEEPVNGERAKISKIESEQQPLPAIPITSGTDDDHPIQSDVKQTGYSKDDAVETDSSDGLYEAIMEQISNFQVQVEVGFQPDSAQVQSDACRSSAQVIRREAGLEETSTSDSFSEMEASYKGSESSPNPVKYFSCVDTNECVFRSQSPSSHLTSLDIGSSNVNSDEKCENTSNAEFFQHFPTSSPPRIDPGEDNRPDINAHEGKLSSPRNGFVDLGQEKMCVQPNRPSSHSSPNCLDGYFPKFDSNPNPKAVQEDNLHNPKTVNPFDEVHLKSINDIQGGSGKEKEAVPSSSETSFCFTTSQETMPTRESCVLQSPISVETSASNQKTELPKETTNAASSFPVRIDSREVMETSPLPYNSQGVTSTAEECLYSSWRLMPISDDKTAERRVSGGSLPTSPTTLVNSVQHACSTAISILLDTFLPDNSYFSIDDDTHRTTQADKNTDILSSQPPPTVLKAVEERCKEDKNMDVMGEVSQEIKGLWKEEARKSAKNGVINTEIGDDQIVEGGSNSVDHQRTEGKWATVEEQCAEEKLVTLFEQSADGKSVRVEGQSDEQKSESAEVKSVEEKSGPVDDQSTESKLEQRGEKRSVTVEEQNDEENWVSVEEKSAEEKVELVEDQSTDRKSMRVDERSVEGTLMTVTDQSGEKKDEQIAEKDYQIAEEDDQMTGKEDLYAGEEGQDPFAEEDDQLAEKEEMCAEEEEQDQVAETDDEIGEEKCMPLYEQSADEKSVRVEDQSDEQKSESAEVKSTKEKSVTFEEQNADGKWVSVEEKSVNEKEDLVEDQSTDRKSMRVIELSVEGTLMMTDQSAEEEEQDYVAKKDEQVAEEDDQLAEKEDIYAGEEEEDHFAEKDDQVAEEDDQMTGKEDLYAGEEEQGQFAEDDDQLAEKEEMCVEVEQQDRVAETDDEIGEEKCMTLYEQRADEESVRVEEQSDEQQSESAEVKSAQEKSVTVEEQNAEKEEQDQVSKKDEKIAEIVDQLAEKEKMCAEEEVEDHFAEKDEQIAEIDDQLAATEDMYAEEEEQDQFVKKYEQIAEIDDQLAATEDMCAEEEEHDQFVEKDEQIAEIDDQLAEKKDIHAGEEEQDQLAEKDDQVAAKDDKIGEEKLVTVEVGDASAIDKPETLEINGHYATKESRLVTSHGDEEDWETIEERRSKKAETKECQNVENQESGKLKDHNAKDELRTVAGQNAEMKSGTGTDKDQSAEEVSGNVEESYRWQMSRSMNVEQRKSEPKTESSNEDSDLSMNLHKLDTAGENCQLEVATEDCSSDDKVSSDKCLQSDSLSISTESCVPEQELKPFECRKCRKLLLNKSNVTTHENILGDDCSLFLEMETGSVSALMFYCVFCHKHFGQRRSDVIRHIVRHHPFNVPALNTKSVSKCVKRSCIFCGVFGKSEGDIQSHILQNHRELLGRPRRMEMEGVTLKQPYVSALNQGIDDGSKHGRSEGDMASFLKTALSQDISTIKNNRSNPSSSPLLRSSCAGKKIVPTPSTTPKVTTVDRKTINDFKKGDINIGKSDRLKYPKKFKNKSKSKSRNKKVKEQKKLKWACNVCGKIFWRQNSYSLRRHLTEVHKIKKLQPVKPLSLISKNEIRGPRTFSKRSWSCPLCKKEFGGRGNKYEVTRHIVRVHHKPGKDDQKLFCQFCKHYEHDAKSLQRHIYSRHDDVLQAATDIKRIKVNQEDTDALKDGPGINDGLFPNVPPPLTMEINKEPVTDYEPTDNKEMPVLTPISDFMVTTD